MLRPGLLLRWLVVASALVVSLGLRPARAQSRDAGVPEPLKPWVPWVLQGHEAQLCPALLGQPDALRCVWPARLTLELDDAGGRFAQSFRVEARTRVRLPGDEKRWPLDVRVGPTRAAVTSENGAPVVELPVGEATVTGRFQWDALPPSLPVPKDTGLLALSVRGAPVALPARDDAGAVWLQKASAAEEGETLDLVAYRHVIDGIPLELVTELVLNVAGKGREVLLGRALPAGLVPLELKSPLPARLEPDGRLRVQVHPGRFTITLRARSPGPVTELARPDPGGPWPESEVWVFEAKPELRVVTAEGVSAIDPNQTTLPAEWKRWPAYPLRVGDVLRLVEKRRGDADPPPDDFTLARQLWLDESGEGYTFHDVLHGTLHRATRLEMPSPAVLGRVAIDGVDRLITQTGDPNVRGVEVRQGELRATADARYEGDAADVPAVAWAQDFHAVSATLHLPPGWRLVHAFGVDEVPGAWIRHWSLFELFVALVAAFAVARLFGPAWGIVAAVTFALTFPEVGAPQWTWIAVLAADALVRALPDGAFRRAFVVLRLGAVAVLVVVTVPFLVHHVRTGLFPALAHPGSVGTARLEDDEGGGLDLRMSKRAPAPAGAVAEEAPPPPMEPAPEGAEVQQVEQAQQAPVAPAVQVSPAQDNAAAPPSGPEEAKPTAAAPPPPPPPPMTGKTRSKSGSAYGSGASGASTDVRRKAAVAVLQDPHAIVQTGPGLPRWRWTSLDLRWSGPVEKDQRMHLVLLSPMVNGALALLRAALVVLLVLRIVPGFGRLLPPALRTAPTTLMAVLALGLVLAPSRAAAQTYPPRELLDDLRARLLTRPECGGPCAASGRLAVDARADVLRLRIELDARISLGVPLPTVVDGASPKQVLVDGAPARGLARTESGVLVVLLEPGSHQVVVEAPLPDREVAQLALPLRPHHVEVTAAGYRIDGVHEDGLADDTLQIARVRAADVVDGGAFAETVLPPFVLIERTLRLGLHWEAETRVVRLTPPGVPVVLDVPLLPGESVTTADVRVAQGRAQVSMAAAATEVAWRSVLEERPKIVLEASAGLPAVEVWRLDLGPMWHATPTGFPPVHPGTSPGDRLPEWRPWPGERLELALARPDGVPGQSLTVDQVSYELAPGLRTTDATLSLELRASRGAEHAITLPEGAELTSVWMGKSSLPLRQEGRKVTLPVAPGSQTARLTFRIPRGVELVYHGPDLDVGAPAVNVSVVVSGLGSRWILAAGGPRLGPVVLFWSLLLVLLVISFALGRVPFVPLSSAEWMLLAVGLSQVDIVAAAAVVGWLLVLGWRKRQPTIPGGAFLFDVRQVVLVLWTVASLAILVAAVHEGLLGAPSMQIQGNGSSSSFLRWYQDRTAPALPSPWVLSLPMGVYRIAMLAWALWLARAVLRWLRWAWDAFTTEGLWRKGGARSRETVPHGVPYGAPVGVPVGGPMSGPVSVPYTGPGGGTSVGTSAGTSGPASVAGGFVPPRPGDREASYPPPGATWPGPPPPSPPPMPAALESVEPPPHDAAPKGSPGDDAAPKHDATPKPKAGDDPEGGT